MDDLLFQLLFICHFLMLQIILLILFNLRVIKSKFVFDCLVVYLVLLHVFLSIHGFIDLGLVISRSFLDIY